MNNIARRSTGSARCLPACLLGLAVYRIRGWRRCMAVGFVV